MRYIFDWCPRYKKAIIKSENLDELRLAFSVENKGAAIRARKQRGYFATRQYAITNSGRVGLGIIPEIIQYIKKNDVTNQITITKQLKEKISCGWDFYDREIITLSKTYRDYQENIIRKCIKRGRGVNLVATAGGKTLIMAGLVGTLLQHHPKYKILIVLPTQLVDQTYTDFLEYGLPFQDVGKWDGKNMFKPENKVIIAGTNILLSKKQDTKWINDVDVLINDETHKAKNGNSITKLLEKITTPHKFGFTGTLPDDKIDEWKVIGLFGPVLAEESSADLRRGKYISDVDITILKISYTEDFYFKPNPNKPIEAYHKELEFIINNEKRNNILTKLCSRLEKNTLLLVDRIEHGEILEKTFKDNIKGKKIYFIQGSVEQETRDKVKKLMEVEDNIICIAMGAIFSTGISINNIHYIIFGAGGKAKTRIVQSIGRGLRLHPRKTKLNVFDITDDLLYGNRHYEKRLLLYDKEKIKYYVRNIQA
jgi:superfamily II DNA or RNA helicase